MKGRKPKPTTLKRLQGNPGKRPLPQNEPAPVAISADEEPPAVLSDQAREYWPAIARELATVGVLTTMDRASLWLLVEAMADYIAAREAVEQCGDTMETGQGYHVVSPWMRQKWKAREHLLKLLVEFGMTPSSRSRVHVAKPPPKPNSFAALRTSYQDIPTDDGGNDE